MKMIFEGSPEEIAKIVRAIQLDSSSFVSGGAPEEPLASSIAEDMDAAADANEPRKFVTTEFAHHVLTRRRLSEGLKTLFITLRDAYPDWVSRDELCVATDYTPHQLAGLMGAFGRRVSHTDRFDPDAWFFDMRWNEEARAWDYRLPDTVLEALHMGDIL